MATRNRRRVLPVPTNRFWVVALVVLLAGLAGLGIGLARAQSLEDEILALTQAAELLVPTPSPTETPRYAPAARGTRLGRAEVEALAAETFGPQLAPKVASVVACESTYQPAADTNYPYVGLMQIDPALHRHRLERVVGRELTLAETRLLLGDPVLNLAVAALIYRDSGWGPWPVCGAAR